MTYPDPAVEPNNGAPPIPGTPLIAPDQMAGYLGLTPPVAAPLQMQIELALMGLSAMIRSETGRSLVQQPYSETFPRGGHAGLRWDRSRQHVTLHLTESPVIQVAEVRVGSVVVPASGYAVHGEKGTIYLHGGLPGEWSLLSVDYVGGYEPLPGDLMLALVDMTRRQLASMGVDLTASGGAAVAGDAPVKAVTVGPLRVEYAIATSGSNAAQSASASPLTEAGRAPFQGIIDRYKSFRMFAATGA